LGKRFQVVVEKDREFRPSGTKGFFLCDGIATLRPSIAEGGDNCCCVRPEPQPINDIKSLS